jgi:hypothetical protein
MPLVTIEQLRDRLGWQDIREEPLPECGMRWLSAVPRDESLPSIDFLFADEFESLQQVGSGEWHYHPDEIDDAIELSRKLIHHESCILEVRDKNGKYRSSGTAAPDEVRDMLPLDADHFIRRFFGMAPLREEIDFSRYIKCKHSYIEPELKAKMDAVWESVGKAPPEF